MQSESKVKWARALPCAMCGGLGTRFGILRAVRCPDCGGLGELFFGDRQAVASMKRARQRAAEAASDPATLRERIDPGPRRRKRQEAA